MNSHLCMTLRFLDPLPQYHGRGDDGEPEWPPSPLRFFQALVAAAATRWRGGEFQEQVRPALQWLEQIRPRVVTPLVRAESYGYRMYVPNNSGDLMTAAWSRGDTDTTMAKFRVEKDVRPLLLRGDATHFVFPLNNDECPHFNVLRAASRSISHLGWGVDMVAGNAEFLTDAEVAGLAGEHWAPDESGDGLRVPIAGTLDALVRKHEAFLQRLDQGGFKPVPPLSAYRSVGYRRATDAARRTLSAFSLLRLDGNGFCAFNPVRHTCTVAGMMRHATAEVAALAGWTANERATVVLGHGEQLGATHEPVGDCRFAFLPVPSIEGRSDGMSRVVGAIRRVLVTSFGSGLDDQIAWARRSLAGAELVAQGSEEPEAYLGSIPRSDKVLKDYLDRASTWATVTPVVLPGYDDPAHYRRRIKSATSGEDRRRLRERLDARIDSLIRKAIVQAGFSEALARYAEIDWSDVGYWRGVELASRYFVPVHLKKLSRLHLRITWRDSAGAAVRLPGPICLGGGRFGGLGLMAAVDG